MTNMHIDNPTGDFPSSMPTLAGDLAEQVKEFMDLQDTDHVVIANLTKRCLPPVLAEGCEGDRLRGALNLVAKATVEVGKELLIDMGNVEYCNMESATSVFFV